MPSPVTFYLPGVAGNLFSIYYPRSESAPDGGDILYVPPFAGEMLNSRNLISAVSRKLTSLGFGVLSVDLYGSGDSAGDFADARWELWKNDLATAVRWLEEQGRERLSLWGLRMGCQLALDFAAQASSDFQDIFLWQPVLSGESMLDEFVRMNFAGDDDIGRVATRDQRQKLAMGESVEIGGYCLAAELIRAIDKLEILSLGNSVSRPIHWTEISRNVDQRTDSVRLQIVENWRKSAAQVYTHKAMAGPFWFFPYCADDASLVARLTARFTKAEYARGEHD